MSAPDKAIPRTIGIGVSLIIFTMIVAVLLMNVKPRSVHQQLPNYGQIHDFSLTNQSGQATSLKDLQGRVWVADIIFTRCPGPCARMTRQMKELQDALPTGSSAKLVSLTTDPEFDTPEVLTRYADRFGANTNRWLFLTGTKKEIGNLAIDSLKLSAVEKKPEERESADDLFVHSTIFVVVDKQGQLRGIFETGGEDVDWVKSKQQILATVQQLEQKK